MIEKIKFNGRDVMYISGIPARDLTPAEWESLEPELRERVLSIGLYEVIEVSPKKSTKEVKND
jgi:hypothetical protein